MKTKRTEVTANSTKNVSGFSSILALFANIGHDSETIGCYEIPFSEIRENSDLRYMLFGREASNHAIRLDKDAANYLQAEYGHFLNLDIFMSRAEWESRTIKVGINGGYFAEDVYVEKVGGVKGSVKQDNNQKIDVIRIDNKRIQVKSSIAYTNNHGSYTTTNGIAVAVAIAV